MRVARALALAPAALAFTLVASTSVHAQGMCPLREWGVRAGGGNSPRTGVEYYALQPYVGLAVWKPAADWFASYDIDALWMIEPWVAFVRDQLGSSQGDGFEIGVSPLLARLTFGDGTFRPFLEGGFGILYTSLRSKVRAGHDLGTPVQFASHFGVGLTYELRPDLALTLEARFRHISNAGLGGENPGINTIYGLAGFTFR
jgi:Lipid A 3-O-deacylase (PagL)